jgi:hypothetical protein
MVQLRVWTVGCGLWTGAQRGESRMSKKVKIKCLRTVQAARGVLVRNTFSLSGLRPRKQPLASTERESEPSESSFDVRASPPSGVNWVLWIPCHNEFLVVCDDVEDGGT